MFRLQYNNLLRERKLIFILFFLLCGLTVCFYYSADGVKRFDSGQEDQIRETCEYPRLNITQFIEKIKIPTYKCSSLRVFGRYTLKLGKMVKLSIPLDGQKYVCLDAFPQMPAGDCVVYSFGINNDWKFDDDIALYGCQVYAFDPSMKVGDHNRSANIHFYNLGISNFTGPFKNSLQKGKVWKMARLEDIMKMLGHEGRVINYLKVDVEGSEIQMMEDLWTTSPHILQHHVAQIGMEIHLGPSVTKIKRDLDTFVSIIGRLECLGFLITHQEPNSSNLKQLSPNQIISCCYEVVWVNQRFI